MKNLGVNNIHMSKFDWSNAASIFSIYDVNQFLNYLTKKKTIKKEHEQTSSDNTFRNQQDLIQLNNLK